jgi:hypothetical protein
MNDNTSIQDPLLQQAIMETEERRKLIQMVVGSNALAKACVDCSFDYAVRLRTGDVIMFVGAEIINSEWIHLDVAEWLDQPKSNGLAYPAKRGIDVRIADIVWVMDAPEGS